MSDAPTPRRLDLTSRIAVIAIIAAGLCGTAALLAIFLVRGQERIGEAEMQAAEATLPPPMVEATLGAAPPSLDDPTGRIVYTCFIDSNDDLCIMDADGSNQQRLTNINGTDFYASLQGDTITFSSRRSGRFEIYTMPAGGGNPTRLTSNLNDNFAPEISPDGSQVVFVSTVNGKQDIYLMDITGGTPTRITTNPTDDLDPTWSPDGTQIAFSSNRTGSNEIYIINTGGTGEKQVTAGSNQREGGRLDWSPDGEWIGFYAGERGDKDIFLVPADCARCGQDSIVRLTAGGNNKAPSFSPDGEWITFASNLDGDDNEVYIMRVDGSDVRKLTESPRANWQPRWGN